MSSLKKLRSFNLSKFPRKFQEGGKKGSITTKRSEMKQKKKSKMARASLSNLSLA
jgi:hypothetical protein